MGWESFNERGNPTILVDCLSALHRYEPCLPDLNQPSYHRPVTVHKMRYESIYSPLSAHTNRPPKLTQKLFRPKTYSGLGPMR